MSQNYSRLTTRVCLAGVSGFELYVFGDASESVYAVVSFLVGGNGTSKWGK